MGRVPAFSASASIARGPASTLELSKQLSTFMSLKNNILASYASQIYATLIGIVMVPVYLRFMGMEAYGLIGFFAMLLIWFQLLDVGLTHTMMRETARYNAGAVDAMSVRRLLRTLEGFFAGIAIAGAACMILFSEFIASGWLTAQALPVSEVQHSLMLIALVLALRFLSSLYKSVVNGFERLVWLSGFNTLIATIRFVLVVPYFVYVGASPVEFFGFQLAVAALELLMIMIKAYRLMPGLADGGRIAWQWEPLRGVLKFSLSIAVTSSVWIFVTQTDKLLLSKLLTLENYAYFSLAVIVANGVMIVTNPISFAIVPRLSNLAAAGDEAGLIRLYRNATQLVGMIAIPAAVVLAFFSENVLWAWTGNEDIVQAAAPVLALYALGNGILALSAFPYYLQFAKGDLRLHLYGSALFLLLLIPLLVWATLNHGAVGAGYAWLFANVVYFLVWTPVVHRRFAKGLHLQWLRRDVAPALALTIVGAMAAKHMVHWPHDRLLSALAFSVVSLALLTVASAGTEWARDAVSKRWHTRSTS